MPSFALVSTQSHGSKTETRTPQRLPRHLWFRPLWASDIMELSRNSDGMAFFESSEFNVCDV